MGNPIYFLEYTSKVWVMDTFAPYGTNVYYIMKTPGYSPVAATTMFPSLYDNFSDSIIDSNKWTTSKSANATLSESAYLQMYAAPPYVNSAVLTSKFGFYTPKIIEYYLRSYSSTNYNSILFSTTGSSGIGNNNYLRFNGSATDVQLSTSTSYKIYEVFKPYYYRLIVPGLYDSNISTGYIGIIPRLSLSPSGGIYVYSIFAREYAETAPTVTVLDQGDRYQLIVQNTTGDTLKNYQFNFPCSSIGGCAAGESLFIQPVIRQDAPDLFGVWQNCEYYYDFNESVADVVGGTTNNIMGGVTLSGNRFAQNKRSISLDGLDDHIDITTNNALNQLNDFTIFVIMNHPASASNHCFLSCRDADADNIGFDCGITNNHPYFNLDTGATYTEMISDNTYSGLIYYGATRSGGNQLMYINGVLNKSTTSATGNLNSTSPTMIGCAYDHTKYDAGKIEAVITWNRALTAEEHAFLVTMFNKRYIYPTHNVRTDLNGKIYNKQRGT